MPPSWPRAFRSPKGRSGSLYASRSERMQNSSKLLRPGCSSTFSVSGFLGARARRPASRASRTGRLGLVQLAPGLERQGQVVYRPSACGVLGAPGATLDLQGLADRAARPRRACPAPGAQTARLFIEFSVSGWSGSRTRRRARGLAIERLGLVQRCAGPGATQVVHRRKVSG